MSTKIEIIPENEQERRIIKEVYEQYKAFRDALPEKLKDVTIANLKQLTKEDQYEYMKYRRSFYGPIKEGNLVSIMDFADIKLGPDWGKKLFKFLPHVLTIRYFAAVELGSINEQITFYEEFILAIDEAFAIHRSTGIFEINAPEIGIRELFEQNPPLETFKEFREIMVTKLAKCRRKAIQPSKTQTIALENISKRSPLKNVTMVLINLYKAEKGIEPLKLKDDWVKAKKLSCYHIYLNIINERRLLKPSEIEGAIEELEDFPTAKEFALKQLALLNQK